MPPAVQALDAATPGGALLVLSLVVPSLGILLAFGLGGRHVERIGLLTIGLGLAVAAAIAERVAQSGAPLVYLLGNWAPPLGVALRADAASAVMMVIVAVVLVGVGLYAWGDFRTPREVDEARRPFTFWILLLGVWAGLNAVFVSGDLFTLYVALELLTFAAVPLVSLDGKAETLAAALRYLLFALIGSIFYLAGAGLIYGVYGTLDIALVAARIAASPATIVALALMTVGLLAKTALVPLHLWLPPAHAGAPAAASAVLSALVVKGSFFIVVRLWFDVAPALPGYAGAQLLGGLGAAAILLGNLMALRQARLKLLIAYSTVAQIGYLFLMFPLAFSAADGRLLSGGALAGGIVQAISHATAKAGMFMAAGLLYAGLGNDRLAGLGGSLRLLPLCILTLAVGGVALMGVPPSGAYVAKELLLRAADGTGQWWWAAVLQIGGVLTSSYLVLVLAHVFSSPPAAPRLRAPVPALQQISALALAVLSLLLGLIHWSGGLALPGEPLSSPLSLETAWKALWPLLAGAGVAWLFGRWGDRPPRVGAAIEWTDDALRQWPVAGISLLLLSVMFGAAMYVARGMP